MDNGTLRTVKGDATEPQRTTDKEIVVIAHCCNNLGAWGKGFVLALSRKWEKPEKVYRDFCERNTMATIILPILGKVCYAKIDNHLVIANMIAQNSIVSADNPIPIKYKALTECMTEVVNYIEMIKKQTSNPVVIHCPKFGSLRAKGNWEFILELIREIWLEQGIDVVVYEFEE